jgi:hypothetical protein
MSITILATSSRNSGEYFFADPGIAGELPYS